jgi:hypothetical protein
MFSSPTGMPSGDAIHQAALVFSTPRRHSLPEAGPPANQTPILRPRLYSASSPLPPSDDGRDRSVALIRTLNLRTGTRRGASSEQKTCDRSVPCVIESPGRGRKIRRLPLYLSRAQQDPRCRAATRFARTSMSDQHSFLSLDSYSRSQAAEHMLNTAITKAKISESFEEYLEIFDTF